MKVVIKTPPFDINTGGIIALFRLCHLLRQEGIDACIWPDEKPGPYNKDLFQTIYRFAKFLVRKILGYRYKTYEHFDTPIAKYSDLKDAVVVYPEIVNGNPLLSKRVVRWLLHKPGFHTGIVDYGSDELVFYYQKAYADGIYDIGEDRMLKTTMILDDIYKNRNLSNRSGTCYIVRKGNKRGDLPDLQGELVIDGRSHEEIATIFNQAEYCVSYDPYTMYSRYAALCGCKSIIVPEKGISKEQWRPDESLRYGLAYGFDDLQYAEDTKQLLVKSLEDEKNNEMHMVRNFVNVCKKHFAI